MRLTTLGGTRSSPRCSGGPVADREREPIWISVAVAAQMMGLCERQARRRLKALDAESDGTLLRPIGVKRMPKTGRHAVKFLVCLPVLRAAVAEQAGGPITDILLMRQEIDELRREVDYLRSAVKPFLARIAPKPRVGRDFRGRR